MCVNKNDTRLHHHCLKNSSALVKNIIYMNMYHLQAINYVKVSPVGVKSSHNKTEGLFLPNYQSK